MSRESWTGYREVLRPATRACVWLRAWLHMVLWQDGIGLVPDKDDRYDPQRITPEELIPSKQTLLWGLSLLPREGWVSLEDFLRQLHRLTERHHGVSLWLGRFVWGPGFETARKKESFPAGPERSWAFWLAQEGVWVSNVLLVTFVWLGLVERGQAGKGKGRHYVFRPTELGRGALAPDSGGQPCAQTTRRRS